MCIFSNLSVNFALNKPIGEYAKLLSISTSRFRHLFTEEFGVSPHKMLLDIRLQNAKHFLTETDLSISEIARQVGYDDALYFSQIFKKQTGKTPKEYRETMKQ